MSGKGTAFSKKLKLHSGSKDFILELPGVMGILNITPDSFYDGGRYGKSGEIVDQVNRMIDEGAAIIDVGGVSTRPNAPFVDEKTEMKRLIPAICTIRETFPGVLISADTFRSNVALEACNAGADMINDVSAGRFDPEMMKVACTCDVPYIMMHMQGTPRTMQDNPTYQDVTGEVYDFFRNRIQLAMDEGVEQLILDPGFGFGKSLNHNFTLLKHLGRFGDLGYPLLVGISRKSMINRVLGVKPDNALNGTSVLNTLAVLNGASILRVHDVKEAVETIALCKQYVLNPAVFS
jgi:dihydropteroate synthase